MQKITIQSLLERGVSELIKKPELEKKLKSKKKLIVKFGIDPTGSEIHLGHLVPIRKLAQFQQAGHEIHFIIGDFTAKIGDPTGKSKTRPQLTDKEIKENEKNYLKQIENILDLTKTKFHHNSDWFAKMTFSDILELTAKFSLSRIIERDDFEKRIKKGQDVRYHEGLYPIMQAYDSVMLKSDLEVGGTDQKFNLLAGRNLQQQSGLQPQDVLMMPMLTGTDGVEKMSKSLNNHIGIKENPSDQYGKVMSIPDILIVEYFHLATNLEDFEVKEIEAELELGKNPKEIKKRLAYAIVDELQGKKAAEQAQESFEMVIEQGQAPSDMDEVLIKEKQKNIVDLIAELNLATSKSEAKRLIEQGGVRIDKAPIKDIKAEIAIHDKMIVNVGKLKFVKIKTKE